MIVVGPASDFRSAKPFLARATRHWKPLRNLASLQLLLTLAGGFQLGTMVYITCTLSALLVTGPSEPRPTSQSMIVVSVL